MKLRVCVVLGGMFGAMGAEAKIDLVTVPVREKVQVTIYNSADLTLVREQRQLTLRKGENRLQFSWANTLIDPTSLQMLPMRHADKIDVANLTFPPRVSQLGLWRVESDVSGDQPVEITYLTSGLSWRAYYGGTLSEDESTMRLQGYVRVVNNSGEDYENAETRLIVGNVHLLDKVADLAKRSPAYGSPVEQQIPQRTTVHFSVDSKSREELFRRNSTRYFTGVDDYGVTLKKEVLKEGLSEYFLYTIEGTETIPHGWSKRLPSFDVPAVPVTNLYKYDESQFGQEVVRFLSFSNDEAHELGETPIPGGALKVFRQVDAAGHLGYEGQSSFNYIPVEEEVELNMGAVENVRVEPVLMDQATTAFEFDARGNISGWDVVEQFEVRVKNTRPVAVKVQVDRHFPSPHWTMTQAGDFDAFEQIDLDSTRFELALNPESEKSFTYVLTTRHGTREQVATPKEN